MEFSRKESSGWHVIRPLAGSKNILTEILFLRSKSWWKWFPGSVQNQTKPTLQQSLARHSFAYLPYLDVLVQSEPCLVCVFHELSLICLFISWCIFFSFVRITSYSILFVFPNLYVHIYLPGTVDRYLDRHQASYIVGWYASLLGLCLKTHPNLF